MSVAVMQFNKTIRLYESFLQVNSVHNDVSEDTSTYYDN